MSIPVCIEYQSLAPLTIWLLVVLTMGSTSTRARQNVILELGYFIGKLGRKRLCIIVEKPLGHLAMARWQQDPDIDSDTADTVLFRLPGVSVWEFPSDTYGITFIDYKDGWGDKLRKELQAAGVI